MKELSMEYVERIREEMLETVKSATLTHEQKVATMANKADALLLPLTLPEGLAELKDQPIETQCICDLFEGNAPLRPRYIIPDYAKLMQEGSRFLHLEPPKDLFEAINALEIFYRHVPSVTNFPVYVGQLDELLEPFVQNIDETLAYKLIRLFFIQMDRTILDSFSHGNIGPRDTKAGRIILRVIADTKDAVPNMTMKYSPEETADEFGLLCVRAGLASAKPSFANHALFRSEFGEDYVIASCYNGLKLGGGAYTLCRLILGNIAKRAKDSEDFLQNQLPYVMDIQARYMDERIRFLVEESGFFENSFLAKEGFIHRDRFSGMFGLVGLADAVNLLLEKEGKQGRFGHDEIATELGIRIMDCIDAFNKEHYNRYCEATGGHFLLHAQVGIASDISVTPGSRIPIGEEPENLVDQLNILSHFHRYFPSGTGDIFPIDMTVHRNPEYVLDIVKGSFRKKLRYLSFYSSDSDVIRITGYLVKKSEIEKLERGENVKHDTTALGMGAKHNGHILERKVR
ncbi:YjjI family glycine radical enzyme [Oribacterium sp. oral taxon 102]|uniref:YjjI family glycine radical enzyme n=1 Tax=Oribacterium sp. oral taxon 102 TaxID=671214 RepID=UPI0015BF16D2|nr:YjjI family glycine radical enzyme [Oribacterium sp. oral taxon 102]NWO20573.1 YjjI family glycine radical enzyme [Oribacterium sp. oral taxon 102]